MLQLLKPVCLEPVNPPACGNKDPVQAKTLINYILKNTSQSHGESRKLEEGVQIKDVGRVRTEEPLTVRV